MKKYHEDKRIRPDILTAAVYCSIIILMLYEVVAVRIYGEKGAGYSAGPLTLFFVFYASFVLAVQKAVYVMARVRAKKSQFINAEASAKRSFKIFGLTGVIITLLIVVAGTNFSATLFGSNRGVYHWLLAAFTVLFLCIQGVIRGYLQGVGYTRPIVLSDIIISLSAFVVGTIASIILYKYGLKVNALFHLNDLSAVYGSTGMMIGIFVASVIGLIQILICFYLRREELKEIVKNGSPQFLDTKNDVLYSIRPVLFLYASPGLLLLVDQIYYNVHHRIVKSRSNPIVTYGYYSGRTIPLVVILSLLCCIPFIVEWNKIVARIEKDTPRAATEKFERFIKHFIEMTIPAALFLLTLASTIDTAVFRVGEDFSVELIRAACFLVVLIPFAIFFSWLLNHMGKSIIIVVALCVAWLVHIFVMVLFGSFGNIGIYGIMLPTMISLLAYIALCFFVFMKMLKTNFNLLVNIGRALIASAVAGFVVFLINKALVNSIGEVLTFIICILFYYAGYVASLVMVGGLDGGELEKVPLGNVFSLLPVIIGREEA